MKVTPTFSEPTVAGVTVELDLDEAKALARYLDARSNAKVCEARLDAGSPIYTLRGRLTQELA